MDEQNNRVDLNTAEIDEIISLPGIGPAMAERIVDARPFTSLDELLQVSGIGETALERFAPLVTLSQTEELPRESITTPIADDETVEVAAPVPEQPKSDLRDLNTEPVTDISSSVIEDDVEADAETLMLPEELSAADSDLLDEEPDQVIVSPIESHEEPMDEIPPVEDVEPADIGDPGPETPVLLEAPAAPADIPDEPEVLPAAEVSAPLKKPRKTFSSASVFWMAVTSAILSIILSTLLVLGILVTVNGGIQYVSPADLNTFIRKANTLETQMASVQQDLVNVRGRMDNLDGLSGRINTVQKENEALSEEIEAISDDLTAISDQSEQLSKQMAALATELENMQERTTVFQSFLDSLRKILDQDSSQ